MREQFDTVLTHALGAAIPEAVEEASKSGELTTEQLREACSPGLTKLCAPP